jgi:glyoxylase I family protein
MPHHLKHSLNDQVFTVQSDTTITAPHHLDAALAAAHLRNRGVRVLGEPLPLPGPEAGEDARFVFALTDWGLALELISYPQGKAIGVGSDE